MLDVNLLVSALAFPTYTQEDTDQSSTICTPISSSSISQAATHVSPAPLHATSEAPFSLTDTSHMLASYILLDDSTASWTLLE